MPQRYFPKNGIAQRFLKAQVVAEAPPTRPPEAEPEDGGNPEGKFEVWVSCHKGEDEKEFIKECGARAGQLGLQGGSMTSTGMGSVEYVWTARSMEIAELFLGEVRKIARNFKEVFADVSILDKEQMENDEEYEDVEWELAKELPEDAWKQALTKRGLTWTDGKSADVAYAKMAKLLPKDRGWSLQSGGTYLALKDAGLLPADHS